MKTPPPRNEAGPHRPSATEPIVAGQMWPLGFLHSKLGVGPRGRAEMIRQGLPVYQVSGRCFIDTTDLIAFIKSHRRPATDQPQHGGDLDGPGVAGGDWSGQKRLKQRADQSAAGSIPARPLSTAQAAGGQHE